MSTQINVFEALREAEAGLEVAIQRILKRDPGHAVHVTSEAKALVAVRQALSQCQGCDVPKDGLHQIAEPAAHTKPMARYCPECGHVGDVTARYRDCCPDGSSAFLFPAKWANELRAGFKAQLAAPLVGQQDVQPVATITGVDEFGPMLGWHEHWVNFKAGTKLYTHPTQQGLDAQALHGEVMNLQVDKKCLFQIGINERLAYKNGHRDARHAAAELVLAAQAKQGGA